MESKQPVAKRAWQILLVAVISIIALCYCILSFPPTFTISLGQFSLPILIPVALVFLLTMYCIATFIAHSGLQGIVISLTLFLLLLFRYAGLTHPLFNFLLIALFASIEFVIYSKNK